FAPINIVSRLIDLTAQCAPLFDIPALPKLSESAGKSRIARRNRVDRISRTAQPALRLLPVLLLLLLLVRTLLACGAKLLVRLMTTRKGSGQYALHSCY